MPSASKGRKGKLGKNKHRIVAYYNEGRNFFNKARRILRHQRRYGGQHGTSDEAANEAIKLCLAGMPRNTSKRFYEAFPS